MNIIVQMKLGLMEQNIKILASLGNSLGLDKSDNPYVIGSPDNPDKFLILGPKLNADLIIHAVGTMAGIWNYLE